VVHIDPASNVTVANLEQDWKTPIPVPTVPSVITDFGIFMLVKKGHSPNAPLLMVVHVEFGSNVTEFNAVHPSKLLGVMIKTVLGIFMLCKVVLFIIFGKFVHTEPVANVIVCGAKQVQNAVPSIEVTVLGIITFVILGTDINTLFVITNDIIYYY